MSARSPPPARSVISISASKELGGAITPASLRGSIASRRQSPLLRRRTRPRKRARSLEPEIRAEPQHVRPDFVRYAGDRVVLCPQVEVQIFGLDRPAARQSDFQAGAGGPADRAVTFRYPGQLGLPTTVSQAAGAVEQNVVERVAGAPAQGAEPRIGEFERTHIVGSAGQLQIGLAAEHDAAPLPVKAGLRAAGHTRRRKV